MTVPTKRDLRICLTVWGLVVEGNESQEELYEAYISQRTYRESHGLSIELRAAMDRYHPGLRPDPRIARYGNGIKPDSPVREMSPARLEKWRHYYGVPA